MHLQFSFIKVHPDSKKALIILVNNINSYGEIGHKKEVEICFQIQSNTF